ncbi:MAG: hypothetical protein OEV41_04290 [Gammaproteobacteria bacterium]|nr:hypothetical protein [Gammaproteobacteria bacterium]MDH5346256.1 hypothetical protein [Gammaproteobacteria bacterium]
MGGIRFKWLALAAAVATFVATAEAGAADLRYIEVDRDDDHYTLRSVTWFEAKPGALYGVLTDYDQFQRFTSAIVESKNLEPDDEGRPEYYTRMEGCVLFWCRSFVRIGYLKLEPMSEIMAVADPERSDFERSTERWQLRPEDGGTLLIYEFEMTPAFWVPPVIGPYYIKRALMSGGSRAVERIEALAQGRQPPP